MTLAQIITLVLAGPVVLMCLGKLVLTLVNNEVNDFELFHAVALMICTVAILISFFGITW